MTLLLLFSGLQRCRAGSRVEIRAFILVGRDRTPPPFLSLDRPRLSRASASAPLNELSSSFFFFLLKDGLFHICDSKCPDVVNLLMIRFALRSQLGVPMFRLPEPPFFLLTLAVMPRFAAARYIFPLFFFRVSLFSPQTDASLRVREDVNFLGSLIRSAPRLEGFLSFLSSNPRPRWRLAPPSFCDPFTRR